MLHQAELHWQRERSWLATFLGVLAVVAYGISFALPALAGNFYGWKAFLWAMFIFVYWPTWAANPVFWFGLVKLCNGRWTAAGNAGIVAVALACSELWLFEDSVQIGYIVWVASMATLALAGWLGRLREMASKQWLDAYLEPEETAIHVLR